MAKFLFYFSYLMAAVYVCFGIGFLFNILPGIMEPYNYVAGIALIIYGVFRAFRIRRDFAYLNHHRNNGANKVTDSDAGHEA